MMAMTDTSHMRLLIAITPVTAARAVRFRVPRVTGATTGRRG